MKKAPGTGFKDRHSVLFSGYEVTVGDITQTGSWTRNKGNTEEARLPKGPGWSWMGAVRKFCTTRLF